MPRDRRSRKSLFCLFFIIRVFSLFLESVGGSVVGVEGILSSVVGREGAEKIVGEVTYGTAVEQFLRV